ncbi:Lrp/AsnC family transcriptional regulator [bacterium]|nr:MAG: Lrp/AsnC family transcriptional regulator [bacterium]
MPTDALDQAILNILRKDARTPHAAIGRDVGLTGPAVLARIRKLEDSGIIRGYRAVVDEAGLRAVVRVVTRPSPGGEQAFERFVLDEPRIEGCYDVDGEDSFLLTVRCADPKDLQQLLLAVRSQPTVLRTVTNIVLSVVKESA